MRKILLLLFIFISGFSNGQVTASFDSPDTVCVNTPVQITNTSVGASSYYWNFCSANINAAPIGTNIGNPSNQLNGPVYIDYAEDNGNFYAFVSNNYSGTLTRLDFGNSLLNTPTPTDLGTVGVMPQNAEGIQVIKDQSNWYVFVVGGDPVGSGTPSKIVKIELGANIQNNSPIGTDWGNIGNLLYPHDLYIFNDNGTWYGITANYSNNTITRFNFSSSFSNIPTAVNLGNIGNLNGPTGLHAIDDNGTWHVFVTNALSSTLSRLDFGGSLLSMPTGVNLGNINNTFSTSWDIFVFKYCGEYVGFLINADQSRNDLIRLNFGSSITNTPTAVSLGNIGNCDFPHCLSKIFRVGPDLYSLITNVSNNTITRLQFTGCTNSSIPNSAAQNPPIIKYNTPGIYNINLTIDDGLPTQTSYCKQIVVSACEKIINDYTEVLGFNICKNEITVADASKYNPGDTVLLIQMKGAIIDSSNTSNFGTITDYRSSGNYEYNYVKQKTGNVIQLKNLVTRTYDIPNGKVQLIRVPYYNNLTTNNTLTCLPWDGGKGGVLVFNVKDTLTMNLNMDVSGKGFRHGSPMGLTNITLNQQDYYYDYSSNDGGEKGEGIYSIGIDKNYGRGSPANAGGGGNAHNSGGGGGGNGGAGGEGGDQWETGDTLAENVGGKGGKALLTNAGLNKLFLGGSGGMGQANDLTEYPAGNGGGIIIFNAGFLNANGNSVYSNGDNATEAPNSNLCRDGMAGGGAGGSILANVGTIVSPLNIEAKGGKGADHIAMNVLHGPGGGGGGGVVAVNQSATPVQYTVDLSGGINGVNVYHNNDPHGALPGSTGIILNNFILPIDTIPFKPNIDSVRIKDTVTSCTSFDFKGFGYTNTAAINSWKWSFGDGNNDTQQNTSHNYASDGTYNVQLIVTDVNGCTDSISKPVTVSNLNIVKSKDTSLCGPNPVQLTASGGASYSWTPASTLSNPNISNPVATPLVTTVYYVTATNAIFSCSKTDSIKITVNSIPTITKTADQNICVNTSLQLFATGGTTYQWSPSSSLSNDAIANPVASPKTNTKYYVTVTNAQGCAKTDSVQIGIYPIANIIIGNDTSICSNASVQLFVSGGSSYLWSPASSLNNANSATPIATPASSTTYHVAIRDTYNCDYLDSVTVNVIPPAVFDVSPNSSVCSQKSAQLSASGGDTYAWSPAAGLNDPNIANPVASPATTTTYTVTIHANACNETGNLSTTITVFSLPSVVAASANDLTCSFGSSQLTATGAASYIWSPSTGLNNPDIANPIASPPATTIYTVTGTDVNGCSNTDTALVKVDFDKNALYLLPNSFTPNGDGINDCFGIKYWGFVQKLDFSIYNRFGEMVFHTADPNTCWDGTYKGRLQEPAVFVYVIRATTVCGEVNRKGTVTLLR